MAPNRSPEGLFPVSKGKKLAMCLREKIGVLDWLRPDRNSSAVGR